MKKLVVYYSFSGHTQEFAQELAQKEQADILEIKEAKKRSKLGAFIPGCPQAMHHTAVPILPPQADFAQYDSFAVCFPIWAGHPAPAFNALIGFLPAGKPVQLYMLSSGGQSAAQQRVEELLKEKGISDISYTDIQK